MLLIDHLYNRVIRRDFHRGSAVVGCDDDLGGGGRLSPAEIAKQIPLPTLFRVVEDKAGLL